MKSPDNDTTPSSVCDWIGSHRLPEIGGLTQFLDPESDRVAVEAREGRSMSFKAYSFLPLVFSRDEKNYRGYENTTEVER